MQLGGMDANTNSDHLSQLGGAAPPTSMRKVEDNWRLLGSRLSTLDKRMHQGFKIIQDVNTGVSVTCIKLMAFDTKTKSHHLNQFIEHADPRRCGIALLGLALLLRIKLGGAGPPTSMRKDAHSWRLFGSNIGTLDKRIMETFKIAGLCRQKNDPVTYLGRHFGTRLLEHAGGSTEGGVAP